jgi:hypothetical protein
VSSGNEATTYQWHIERHHAGRGRTLRDAQRRSYTTIEGVVQVVMQDGKVVRFTRTGKNQ